MRHKTISWLAKLAQAILLVLSTTGPARAAALAVEPLFIELAPGASAAVRVRNTSDAPTTVELSIEERAVDEQGTQTRTDAEDSFVLFPPQGVIAPQQVQVFRIQPLKIDPTKSHSYFLTVRQLPVKLDPIEGGGTQLQVVFAFDVAVHTVPRGARNDPVLVSAGLDTTQVEKVAAPDAPPPPVGGPRPAPVMETVPAMAVTLRNDGNKYLYLQDLDYDATGIDQAGNKIDLPDWNENAIVDAAQVALVPPGATRSFKLPLRGAPALKGIELRLRPRAGR